MRHYSRYALGILLSGCVTSAVDAGIPPPHATRPAAVRTPDAADVRHLAGIDYRIVRSGANDGPHPKRADSVAVRYVGRLPGGEIFSTSADNGAGASMFKLSAVIPGFNAICRLMTPGDRWVVTLPAYLAYGPEGKAFGSNEATLKRAIPPNSVLIFDVELVAIVPGE